MGVIILTEDTEILVAIKYYLEKELNIELTNPERVGINRGFMYKYRVDNGGKILYTIVSNGKDAVLKDFKTILKFYKRFKNDTIQAIFLYFDKDAENIVKKKIEKLKEEFQDLEINFDQNVGKYKDFKIYLISLGKELELCGLRIVTEFETLFLKNEKEEIERELCNILKSKNITKASLIFPLKMVLIYKRKPDIKIYLDKSKLDLREELRIEEIIKYLF